ncbi:connectin-like isoform X1 [Macrobrachium nipponense]|uniref:connectin-like isoform X1 n=1 Tax=Macrobrachium nipponense TaxID=159736 RepID=UPI0030C823F7
MLPEKLLFHLKVLFCMVVVATEGKKKKAKKEGASTEAPLHDQSAVDLNFNMCDIQTPEVIYCYCDVLDMDSAEEGNCWIFNDTTENDHVWEGFVSQTKIKRLTLHLRPDGTLKKIPTVAIQHLPGIEMFEVQYATIGSIHAFSFGNSTTLTKVSLSRNSISTLARNAFARLPALDTLSLGENQITEVNRHVFFDLPNLKKLYIDRNNITTVYDKAFQGLQSLVELELFANQIQVITSETFKGLSNLERLDLHKNRLEVIGDMTFQDLVSLKMLDLQENSLKYIAPNSLYGLGELQHLNLQDNKLLSLGAEVFQPTPNIHHLDIRANVLETLTEQSVQPIMDNLNNSTMIFFLEGNNFRCDNRLSWMFTLRNTTKSKPVRRNLESLICYLEIGTLPPRLEGETVTPVYETTTLGIGPMMKLFALHESELPDPTMRWLQTEDPDCEEEKAKEQLEEETPLEETSMPQMEEKTTEATLERKRGRARGRKKVERNKAQNDRPMEPLEVTAEPQHEKVIVVAPAPVQEESRAYDNTSDSYALTPTMSVLALTLALVMAQH